MLKQLLLVSALTSAVTFNALCADGNDTAFASGSGIKDVWLHDNKASELARLGMVWGFMKYHHPSATTGKVDMDAELFKVMPRVIAAANTDSAFAVIERWVDGFGKPAACVKCATFTEGPRVFAAPDYAMLFIATMPASLKEKLEYIKTNREAGKKQHYVKPAANIGNPEFTNEREYASNPYPDAGMRLLGLFRYWNMIQYYSPNRHLAVRNRGKMLADMVLEFCNAQDTTAYQVACLKLVTRINDGHAWLTAEPSMLRRYQGIYITPFTARFVQDQLVCTGYYKDTLKITNSIKPGDVIETIDGVTIPDLIRRYLDKMPASNYERKLYNMAGASGFLLRGNTTTTKLNILRDGNRMEVTVPRILLENSMMKADMGAAPETGYKMLAGNMGYINPAKLTGKDLEAIKETMGKTKGLVVDMRCVPGVFMPFDYGDWLKPEATPFVKFAKMNAEVPGAFEFAEPVKNGGGKAPHYNGKLAILVDTRTQSSAEYQTMALQTTPGAKVIGSQTSGTDGDVSEIVLPGGIHTYISGLGVFYPDGTETQAKGIKIDKEVRPTVRGVAEGRDEVLDAAVQIINGQ